MLKKSNFQQEKFGSAAYAILELSLLFLFWGGGGGGGCGGGEATSSNIHLCLWEYIGINILPYIFLLI